MQIDEAGQDELPAGVHDPGAGGRVELPADRGDRAVLEQHVDAALQRAQRAVAEFRVHGQHQVGAAQQGGPPAVRRLTRPSGTLPAARRYPCRGRQRHAADTGEDPAPAQFRKIHSVFIPR
ncbi:hypothetical protein HEK616_59590 [Streptomyces nigrescens]|uniref:Uncharacterized protein n=1 Tax=Streptomyces nigrescens TaxID=1920 RepID=A0ABM8A1Q3_STRNI|nr:hypothetical protein HEK616_59590 [Streptomyces nigrescens]